VVTMKCHRLGSNSPTAATSPNYVHKKAAPDRSQGHLEKVQKMEYKLGYGINGRKQAPERPLPDPMRRELDPPAAGSPRSNFLWED